MIHGGNKETTVLRFEGFTDDWEQRKLGDMIDYVKGYAFKSETYQTSGTRIIRVSDLGLDKVKDEVDAIFVDEETAHIFEKYRIFPNDVIITTVGSKAEMKDSAVGRPIIMLDDKRELLNQNLVKITALQSFDSYFIYSSLLCSEYPFYISLIERGNANQANIAIADLWEYPVSVPSYEEQNKVGAFFTQIDMTITLHHRKLEKLKELKKSMIQKMFV
jgi:type I restriction enzyme S subunit